MMTSFLFIVSFLLHILLLIIVFYLYQHIQTLKTTQTSETEEMLNEFLQQLKIENKKLESKVHHPIQHTFPEQKSEQINEQSKKGNDSSYAFPPIDMEESNVDHVETSLHSQVFHLHKKGLSIEEIAKKLNRGKTEIQLMIKFRELDNN